MLGQVFDLNAGNAQNPNKRIGPFMHLYSPEAKPTETLHQTELLR